MKLVVDGNGFAFRAIHTNIEPMVNAKGHNITIIYMIVKMLMFLVKNEEEVTEIIFAWDIGKSRAKKEIDNEYKATREMTDEKMMLINQINIIKSELFPFLNIKQVSIKDIEADDVIAILSRAFASNKTNPEEVLIVSSDKDLLQLVSPKIHVFNPIKKRKYTIENFEDVVGLPKDGFIDYLVLLGDSCDNIKGIDGIGETTAKWAIQKYKTIDNIYNNEAELRVLCSLKGPERSNAKRLMSIFSDENRHIIQKNKNLITLGKLLTENEKREIISIYVNSNSKIDHDSVLNFFKKYQLLEFQKWHDDIMHLFASITPKRKKSIYVF